jgi:lipase
MSAEPAALQYTTVDVPVRGGTLRTGVWGPQDPQAPAVLAVHGVTASHRTWGLLAGALDGVRVIAPDLRGRGRSNGLPGPFGMAAHADDLAAVLAAQKVGSAVVVGHSMGAFASVVLARRYPDLVQSLVLVDGGLPLQVPAGLSDDEVIQSVLGPAAERLAATFPSKEAYRDFWRVHPAFADHWNPLVEDYVDYDLAGEPPLLRPATNYDAMARDTADLNSGAALMDALQSLDVPAVLLRAPRGLQNEEAGLYTPGYVDQWARRLPGLQVRDVPGTNHYTIVMDAPGAAVVADAVQQALAR